MPRNSRYKHHKAKSHNKANKVELAILILNIIAGVALLLSYLAPSTDPRDYSIIALLGFTFPIIFIINILFAIYWAIRKKYLAFISIACVLLGYNNITVSYGFRHNTPPLPDKPKDAIRMMAYNVNIFLGIGKFDNNPIQKNVFEIINRYKPDIISFEEYRAYQQEKGSTSDSVKKLMNTTHYFFKAYKVSSTHDSTGYAIFSRYPIIHTDTIAAPRLLNLHAIYADIKYQNKIIRIYSIHLAAVSIKSSVKRQYTNGNNLLSGSSLIESKLTSAFVFRSYQVDRIKAHMDKCPYPYIVAGDFNDTPVSFAVNTIGLGLKNAFREKGSGWVTTYYSSYPLQIDNIMTSQDFNVLTYTALDEEISDHKPLISDLKFNN